MFPAAVAVMVALPAATPVMVTFAPLAVLAGLTVSEIAALAGRWREFDRKENPSAAGTAEELENVKKN